MSKLTKQEIDNIDFKRGQIYIADLGKDVIGSEQGGIRPVLILQNDVGNKHSPNLIVLPLTTKTPKKQLPTQVRITKEDYKNLTDDSVILADQWKTISKQRVTDPRPLSMLHQEHMRKVEESVRVSVGIIA